tara:strand:- start:505 stop:756 length:252 start_codon:yes stop_codon:yes gene_type:complete
MAMPKGLHVENLKNRTQRGTKSKNEREIVALSVYASLNTGWVDGQGKLHKLTPGGAGEKRMQALLSRAESQKRIKKVQKWSQK